MHGRPAIIYAHPRSEVRLQDPREQPVMTDDPPVTDSSVLRALKACHAELQQTVAALAHTPDTCTACGHPTADHFGGCALAIRANKPMQTAWPVGVLYGDPHLEVTRAITVALEESCGPAVALLYEALGNDERLMVARQLSRVASSALLAELAK